MKPMLATVVSAAIVSAMAFPVHAEDASAVGFWVTQNHESVVEIMQCGDRGLCGRLVGLKREHPPGDNPKDTENSDPAKRGEPLCGLMMMGSFKPSDKAGKWEDGWVYDPEGGKTYSGSMTLDGADTLNLRGFIGISLFGRTETWTRENGAPNRCSTT